MRQPGHSQKIVDHPCINARTNYEATLDKPSAKNGKARGVIHNILVLRAIGSRGDRFCRLAKRREDFALAVAPHEPFFFTTFVFEISN
jgi:hypothetical protein